MAKSWGGAKTIASEATSLGPVLGCRLDRRDVRHDAAVEFRKCHGRCNAPSGGGEGRGEWGGSPTGHTAGFGKPREALRPHRRLRLPEPRSEHLSGR